MHAINIASFFDQEFHAPAAILIGSLQRTATPGRPVIFHAFLCGDFDESIVEAFKCMSLLNFEVRIYRTDNPFNQTNPVAFYNYVLCYRLHLSELLDCERVIYLDADTMCRRSLDDLYDLDLHGNTVGAVREDGWNRNLSEGTYPFFNIESTRCRPIDYYRKLNNFHISGDYFNSGVMIIDISEWRRLDVGNKCLDYLKENVPLPYCDQDALNHVLCNRVLLIDRQWNYIPDGDIPREFTIKDPSIVHFVGSLKPWSTNRPWSASEQVNQFATEYWNLAVATKLGDSLAQKFFSEASNKRSSLEEIIAARLTAIPPSLHPHDTSWTRFLPPLCLKLMAELCCTFGRGKLHRLGEELWNAYKKKRAFRVPG